MRVCVDRIAQPGYWYRHYIGLEFDVSLQTGFVRPGHSAVYQVLDTPHNRSILPVSMYRSFGILVLLGEDVSEVDVDNEQMVESLRRMEDF